MSIERGIELRDGPSAGGRRDSRCARARCARAAGPADGDPRAGVAGPRPSGRCRRPATAPRASRGRRAGARELAQRRDLAPARPGIVSGRGRGERVEDGAAGEDEALAERVRGEAVGAVQARAGGLADGIQPGQARARVQVGDDPTHHVVRRRGDRDQLARRVEARLAQRGDDVGEVARGRSRACRGRPRARRTPAGAARSRGRPRRAGRARRRSARRPRRAGSRPRRGSPR